MSKLINISDKTYEKLKSIKGKESFTFVIENLLEKETNTERVLSCAGKGGINGEAVSKLKEGWKKWTKKYA
jgi:predicted CopG family antitoxin